MFRIGIMGAENSHAMAFTEAFNGLVPDLADEFQDIHFYEPSEREKRHGQAAAAASLPEC